MRRFWFFILFILSVDYSFSIKYIRPVFDRTDNYVLHLDSVEQTKDSIFLFFTYDAEAGSWANISIHSFIRDCETNQEYQIQNVSGIPFTPNKRHFSSSCKLLVRMSFNAGNFDRFDFIENESDSLAFNIRGINLLEKNPESASQSNLEKAASNSSRADFYFRIDDYKKAFELELEAMPIYMAHLGKKSVRYAISVMNLALYSWKMGNYEKAIYYGKEDLSLSLFFYGKEHETYANSLSSLAIYYQSVGDFIQSKALNEEVCKIRKKLFGDKSPEYANALTQLAKDYQGIGDIIQAIEYTEQSLAITNKEDILYLLNLNNLASLYSHLHQIERADSIETEVVKMAESVFGKHHSEYATYLGNLAGYKALQGDYFNAIQLAKESLHIDEAFGPKSPKYKKGLNNLAYLYYHSGDIDSALSTLHKCYNLYEIDDKITDRINYVSILQSLAECYASKGNFQKAVSFSKEAIESSREYLGTTTGYMTINEKYFYWQQYHGLFDDNFPYYVAKLKDDSHIPYLYDVVLYSNGFSFRNNNADCSWVNIQKSLTKDDVAIEFLSPTITLNQQMSMIFYALISDCSNSPQMVELFDLNQLSNALSQSTNKDSTLAELIWKPILPQITKYKRIFFSPTFIFDAIGIEYFPIAENYICDMFQMYRMSSTREIIRMHSKNSSFRNSVLYGSLDYDNDDYSQVIEGINSSRVHRGSYDPLPHTQKEITDIAKILKSNSIDCKILSGNEGTEESFKAYSGQSPDIIHFATHGSYLNSNKAATEKSKNNLSFISSDVENSPMNKEKVLTRSFLILSGGNRLIQREPISAEHDDGILTAAEISHLDLSKTDLVVLSACESGLGDWSVDGGLMGLQRGFKEAGVKTILMSLRKVDDEATQILMVEFYKNLMSGKSKHLSLKDAQKYLRQYEDGKYDDPKYWAAFILLDGLD
ncbi:MAG: CHAT domain-containing protein [Bacteroidaceae bacterium]|nr:CHAT domain-containing protein [Bacteroidaceae bacterium]